MIDEHGKTCPPPSKLEHMLHNGWAIAIYVDGEGELHTGFIEREPIEAAVTAQEDGEDEWGQAMVTLGVPWRFTRDPAEALASKLKETAELAYAAFCVEGNDLPHASENLPATPLGWKAIVQEALDWAHNLTVSGYPANLEERDAIREKLSDAREALEVAFPGDAAALQAALEREQRSHAHTAGTFGAVIEEMREQLAELRAVVAAVTSELAAVREQLAGIGQRVEPK